MEMTKDILLVLHSFTAGMLFCIVLLLIFQK